MINQIYYQKKSDQDVHRCPKGGGKRIHPLRKGFYPPPPPLLPTPQNRKAYSLHLSNTLKKTKRTPEMQTVRLLISWRHRKPTEANRVVKRFPWQPNSERAGGIVGGEWWARHISMTSDLWPLLLPPPPDAGVRVELSCWPEGVREYFSLSLCEALIN